MIKEAPHTDPDEKTHRWEVSDVVSSFIRCKDDRVEFTAGHTTTDLLIEQHNRETKLSTLFVGNDISGRVTLTFTLPDISRIRTLFLDGYEKELLRFDTNIKIHVGKKEPINQKIQVETRRQGEALQFASNNESVELAVKIWETSHFEKALEEIVDQTFF